MIATITLIILKPEEKCMNVYILSFYSYLLVYLVYKFLHLKFPGNIVFLVSGFYI